MEKLNVQIGQLKWRTKKRINNILVWASNNRELAIFLAPTLFGAIKWSVKTTTKALNNKKEEDLKNLYKWDPSAGCYYHLRRPLTNSEKRYVDRLVHDEKRPMRMGDVLEQMKVLK